MYMYIPKLTQCYVGIQLQTIVKLKIYLIDPDVMRNGMGVGQGLIGELLLTELLVELPFNVECGHCGGPMVMSSLSVLPHALANFFFK